MTGIFVFLKNWTLPIAMLAGVVSYFAFVALPLSSEVHIWADAVVSVVQPALIFAMLFLTFCKVSPHDMHPQPWHIWIVLIQVGVFVLGSMLALLFPEGGVRILIEGCMICFICPTATAAAVIVGRLGGRTPSLITYIIFSNLIISLVAPVFLTLVNPRHDLSFGVSFFMIMGKVFPLLICPLLAAWLVRFLTPAFHRWLQQHSGVAFYLWAVALALSIVVTVKAIAHSTVSIWYELGLALVSLVCCLLQFYLGRLVGMRYDDRISAGQALGQKNTVFAIWMAYTFLTPITSIVGGFYSVWHNVVNSWQLYKVRKFGHL